MFLTSIHYKPNDITRYPFSLPIFAKLQTLTFTKPVTLFVGENGTGKSTLLQGLACITNRNLIGAQDLADHQDMRSGQELAKAIRPTYKTITNRGFFLRAEDFISFSRRVRSMIEDAENELKQIEIDYKGRSAYAKSLASLPHTRTLHDLRARYGDGLDVRSHGEKFLDFFYSQIHPSGLYILDEPEAPLSPIKQIALIKMIIDSVGEGSQFMISTHSPILMAIPGATIYSLEDDQMIEREYEEIEHVQLTKQFLESPERFLRHL
ncbi:predicted ATPase [Bacillus oleivorans]|uniref:Predicted ATPase n=1 Tax=Bacillus oleivorans TaxID=1448271 RepID=A0A285CK41_9BACI|nr:AAA family ATPase [Bacillus oleivorans]SNX67951.1 predicted ATPase [Bacillus oleivorans]